MDHNSWINQEKNSEKKLKESEICSFKDRFKCSEVLVKLLWQRGYFTEEDIESFLNPSMETLHNKDTLSMLPNINEAIERLKEAHRNKEKIIIFGDYDTDGVISTAILYNFLKKAGFEVDYHIPDRFEDGYDINMDFVKKTALKKKYNLIICVDCGTNAYEVMNFVETSKSIDVIVCDHHEPVNSEFKHSTVKNPESSEGKASSEVCNQDTKKDALGKSGSPIGCLAENTGNKTDAKSGSYIIINPKLEGSRYPYKFLSGAGVTFKFIIASLRSFDQQIKKIFPNSYLKDNLDLVAISTVADVMPLTGENRIIVKAGLELLKNTKHAGLEKIISEVFRGKTSGRKEKFTAYDIGYVISPRLNASGRIKNAKDSVRLLINNSSEGTSDAKVDLGKIVEDIESFNKERRYIQQEIFNSICKNYDFNDIVKNKKIFIESSKLWHEGVLGIVASSIVKKFNIPAILFKDNGKVLKGSGRSVFEFDLYENLETYKKYFIKFGGHRQACGITIQKDQFELFKSQMCALKNPVLKNLETDKKYYYDLEVKFSDLDNQILRDLEKMEPFGTGNPKPLFFAKNCDIVSKPTSSGNGNHIFLKLQNNDKILNAVFFNYSTSDQKCSTEALKNNSIDILFNLNKTNKEEPQLILQGLKINP